MHKLILLLIGFNLFGAPTQLVKDINTIKEPLNPIIQAQSGNKIFFSRRTPELGSELWVTDGTTTQLVKDIEPGTSDSNPMSITPTLISGNPGVYFYAKTSAYGTELWISDGTTDGTKIVKDINPGTASSATTDSLPPQILTIPGTSDAFFTAYTPANGRELWGTSGSNASTILINDLYPGAGSSNPAELIYTGTIVAFVATTPTHGRELFGTNVLFTVNLADILSGELSSNPSGLTVANNKLIFYAADFINGIELRQLDLGTFTTGLVKDLIPGTGNYYLYAGNQFNSSKSFYYASSYGVNGEDSTSQIIASDGTNAGTTLQTTINCIPGGNTSLYYSAYGLKGTRNVNGKQVFLCQNSLLRSSELYVNDGTSVSLLKDIFPGNPTSEVLSMYNGNNKIIFNANNGTNGMEPWVTDGTTGGTTILGDFNPGEASSIDTSTYYEGLISPYLPNATASLISITQNGQRKVFYTDGTLANTKEIFNNSSTKTTSSYPSNFSIFGKGILFSADDPIYGKELFYSDGTSGKTTLVKNIFKSGNSSPESFRKLGSKQLFIADHPSFGKEIWITNGKKTGTSLVRNVYLGSLGSDPEISNEALNGKYLFFATNTTNGRELWITNGTKKGTKIVKDINPGITSSISMQLYGDRPEVFVSSKLKRGFFTADDGVNGKELWITDGTTAGTKLLKDINPGASSSEPYGFVSLGKKVIFRANNGTNGEELWITNGTTAGTILLSDIKPGVDSSNIKYLTTSGAVVYFVANNGTNGEELFRTNGTTTGTFMVTDIAPGASGSSPYELTTFTSSRIIFKATDSSGTEPWIASPTVGSAIRLADIYPGASSSSPSYFYQVPGKSLVFFSATDPTFGSELWKSNGTQAGTVLVEDIIPGSDSSYPYNFIANGKKLFFTSEKDNKGQELILYNIQ